MFCVDVFCCHLRQDISKPIPDVRKMFARFDMMDELRHIRKSKTWKGAHTSFDPLGQTKAVEKQHRIEVEEAKLNAPRVHKQPPKKSTTSS